MMNDVKTLGELCYGALYFVARVYTYETATMTIGDFAIESIEGDLVAGFMAPWSTRGEYFIDNHGERSIREGLDSCFQCVQEVAPLYGETSMTLEDIEDARRMFEKLTASLS